MNNLCRSGRLGQCRRTLLRLASREVGWVELKHRKVIRVSGPDSLHLLQGMVTNDTSRLGKGERSLYTLMLNTQGRVDADLILHSCDHGDGQRDVLVECDQHSYSHVANTMLKYKMRKKVDLQGCMDSMRVLALFPLCVKDASIVNGFEDREMYLMGTNEFSNTAPPLAFGPDPRVPALGSRLIVCTTDVTDQHPEGSVDDYESLRYRMGVGEGPIDIPPSKALPLEVNGDYLHGISFHKGCYIGQELTARTHHTGVVRKRLLPLTLAEPTAASIHPDTPVLNITTGKNVGKWRAGLGAHGLGLIRIDEAMSPSAKLTVNNVACTVVRPYWWPESHITGIIRNQ